ncbi:hypothetical protein Indivirus_9_6 [Indivirus ILV1]|uniref:C2H2-type domain-containing protein n=1 Tax=Indivirus ILV1 TaxID=1977633 RepID=A0A1V0SE74_9VIRU|nr:hypothetical protein Indivirus_9_6 [Indivirus ILV1]
MVKYECSICDFTTEKKTDYSRHLQTKRHLQKVQEQCSAQPNPSQTSAEIGDKMRFECNLCSSKFTRLCNLTRHKSICAKSNIDMIKTESANEKVRLLEREIERLLQENNTFQEILKRVTCPQTVNNITFVVNNYPDAPALEKLPTYKNLLEAKKMTLIDVVIMYYNDKKLDKFVGDFIIKSYKKNNAKDQSIWSSDIARLTYIIRESCKNTGADIWSYDKGGVKVKEFIIDPALNYIKNELIKYSDAHNLTTDEKTLNTLITITEIIMIINNNTLSDNIIRYIAPNFALKPNRLIDIKS